MIFQSNLNPSFHNTHSLMMIFSSTITFKTSFPTTFLSLFFRPKPLFKLYQIKIFLKKLYPTTMIGSLHTIEKQNHWKNCRRSSLSILKERGTTLFSLIKSHNNLVFKDVESMMWSIFFKVWMLSLKREKIIINGRDFMRHLRPSTSVKKILKTSNF